MVKKSLVTTILLISLSACGVNENSSTKASETQTDNSASPGAVDSKDDCQSKPIKEVNLYKSSKFGDMSSVAIEVIHCNLNLDSGPKTDVRFSTSTSPTHAAMLFEKEPNRSVFFALLGEHFKIKSIRLQDIEGKVIYIEDLQGIKSNIDLNLTHTYKDLSVYPNEL